MLSIEILPKSAAEARPVGKARKEPNMYPFLPPPSGRIKWVGATGVEFTVPSPTLAPPPPPCLILRRAWASVRSSYHALHIHYVCPHPTPIFTCCVAPFNVSMSHVAASIHLQSALFNPVRSAPTSLLLVAKECTSQLTQ